MKRHGEVRPLSWAQRRARYLLQTGRSESTPRQLRRLKHKQKRASKREAA